jgi:hypothetical protein
MAIGYVGQHMRTATPGGLQRTLFVRRCSVLRLRGSRLQILWFFQSPMAVELTLTRCAISLFFLRTFYTKTYPWLRRTGTCSIKCDLTYHNSAYVDTLYSVLVHRFVDGFWYCHHYWNVLTLPPLASQLGIADSRRPLLLRH